ncbi:MAG: cell division protein ZapA [bacterium]|nr:cell division protein ZapA [bacterium]
MKYRTEVEIFGHTYIIKGEEESEYVRQLANYVDQEMRKITQKTNTISTSKVAVLVALNIADELFKTRELVNEKTTSLIDRIDAQFKKENESA